MLVSVLHLFAFHVIALSALGGCLNYLQELRLDEQLASLRRFSHYAPMDSVQFLEYLVLDGKTLNNLEIFGLLIDPPF